MALLNSKSPERPGRIEQLSCRFARTSGRWVASPLSHINKAARTRGVGHPGRYSPVSLSKVMAEPVRTLSSATAFCDVPSPCVAVLLT